MHGKKWILIGGLAIGLISVLLVFFGNPGNMGYCIACFIRDTAGALGVHPAAAVQYIRPEIIGLVLGSLIAALIAKEFMPRGGSSPATRFVDVYKRQEESLHSGYAFRRLTAVYGYVPVPHNQSRQILRRQYCLMYQY